MSIIRKWFISPLLSISAGAFTLFAVGYVLYVVGGMIIPTQLRLPGYQGLTLDKFSAVERVGAGFVFVLLMAVGGWVLYGYGRMVISEFQALTIKVRRRLVARSNR